MNRINNNVSFNGYITVRTWDRLNDVYKKYPTTEFQDKLIKKSINNIVKDGDIKKLSQKEITFINKLIEKITGHKIRNIKNIKKLQNNGNYATYKDENFRLLDGVFVDMRWENNKF